MIGFLRTGQNCLTYFNCQKLDFSILCKPITKAENKPTVRKINIADFSKVFDLIDHKILITELRNLEVSEIILDWISAFLVDCRQAVRVGGTLSKWNILRGGIPQGTKLGVVLFAVMTNSLLVDWHLRTKFVDDTSAVKILPRNSISLLKWQYPVYIISLLRTT